MRIIKIKEVIHTTGLSKTTLYKLVSEGKFPKSVTLGGYRGVGWLESEVQQWIRQRIEERDGCAVAV